MAAAAEVLADIFQRRAAADRTLAAWGRNHRFAGSKDRAAIADRVYTVLRRRNECAFRMQSDEPRALVIGSLAVADGFEPDQIAALCVDGQHALGALSEAERVRCADKRAPEEPWVLFNYPQWLHSEFVQAFGDDLPREMAALCGRAPLDLRVNALKADRDSVVMELMAAGVIASTLGLANGLRIPTGSDAKITALPAYLEGRIEIQDEASQRAVLVAEARPEDTVVDLAAGAGGKALALAVEMENRGRVLACDVDPTRLQAMLPRLQRSGASIVELAGDPYADALTERVVGGADLVFVDAPCSGSGTWRRNPEAKWTLDPARLDAYRTAQRRLLDRAADLVKPSGVIVYATCSLLPSEGPQQLIALAQRRPGWKAEIVQTMTPYRDRTDGFFVARLVWG